jgi:chromosome segregation ATPase
MSDELTPETSSLPALPSDVEMKLSKIEKQLRHIAERQSSTVSPEFNALMDGYVNKANESQEFKVKYTHLETVHDELQTEYKKTLEENKKLKQDNEAAREALRMSEADLQRLRKDLEIAKQRAEEHINNLVQERESLKSKNKQFFEDQEKLQKELNEQKSELLEHRYKTKQLEQEKHVELENQKRLVKEANKLGDELKEKLELRTREVEYKDALLNQLIKQVSTEDTQAQSSVHNFRQQETFQPEMPSHHEMPTNQTRKVRPNLHLNLDDDSPSPGASWGAFKK